MRGHHGAALRALGQHTALRSVLGQRGAVGQRNFGNCMLATRSGASRSGALHFMSAPLTSLTGPLVQGNANHLPWLRAVRWNSSQARMQGTVKMWNEERGFGFIRPEDGGEDVFVHRSAVGEGVALSPGVFVSYEGIWDERKRKYRASNLTLEESGVAEASAATPAAAPAASSPSFDRPSAQRAPARPPAFSALHMVATFTDWDIHKDPMSDGRHRIIIRSNAPQAKGDNRARREEFQILGDGDWDKRFYPSGGDREEVVVIRPGGAGYQVSCDRGKGHGRNWAVEGRPGAAFDILFDAAAMTVSCEEAFSESQGR